MAINRRQPGQGAGQLVELWLSRWPILAEGAAAVPRLAATELGMTLPFNLVKV